MHFVEVAETGRAEVVFGDTRSVRSEHVSPFALDDLAVELRNDLLFLSYG